MAAPATLRVVDDCPGGSSREVLLRHASEELVFGVVGHVGSGNSAIAEALKSLLIEQGYSVELLKAKDCIRDWAELNGRSVPTSESTLVVAEAWQTLGDEMRSGGDDDASVARALVLEIRRRRAVQKKEELGPGPVLPDGTPRAYVLDSLRHDAEVQLVRHVYGNAFALIGIVCDEEVRRERLGHKYSDAGQDSSKSFMERDSKSCVKHGQRVSAAFELADYYLDNSEERYTGAKQQPNPRWDISEQLSRLIKIIQHKTIIGPTTAETGMFFAHGARMRSACLSRQVGAALVDPTGNIVATGTNEVPKAGGGVYPGPDEKNTIDARCAFRGRPECSNNTEQTEIIAELIASVPELKSSASDPVSRARIEDSIRKTRVGSLIEFSRAVHAEMDALMSAARLGVSPVGSRMFVTTFPCHFCARHIVAAGVVEVQYIEPYPKSKALALHDDAIIPRSVVSPEAPGKVLFRPFKGVAPRLYPRAFLKDRELKNDRGAMDIQEPRWGCAWHLSKNSYVQLEAELAKLDRT